MDFSWAPRRNGTCGQRDERRLAITPTSPANLLRVVDAASSSSPTFDNSSGNRARATRAGPNESSLRDRALHRVEHVRRDLRDAVGIGDVRANLRQQLVLCVGTERCGAARHDIATRK